MGSKEVSELVDQATAKPPALQFSKVSKWFAGSKKGERIHTLDAIDFAIEDDGDGEVVAILGPSGSGKSTMLNLISGMLEPDAGEITVCGKPVMMPNPDSVTVPQAYTCFPWLTVQGNVEFGLGVMGKSKSERSDIAMEYLEKVGLKDRASAMPRELSGGMQQRVAIARALAMKPPIVLMDEPFGALDPQIREEMQQMLLDLWSVERNLIIFVTHDITEAVFLADRVFVLSSRPAKIIHEMRVPFGRPRKPDIKDDHEFGAACQYLLNVLKSTPTTGQVRVTL